MLHGDGLILRLMSRIDCRNPFLSLFPKSVNQIPVFKPTFNVGIPSQFHLEFMFSAMSVQSARQSV